MRMYGATNPPTQRLATVYVNVNGVQNSFTSSTYLGKPTVKMWAMEMVSTTSHTDWEAAEVLHNWSFAFAVDEKRV